MSRRLSLRWRTALAAAAAIAPVLVGAGVAGVLVQRHELVAAAALVARDRAQALAEDAPDGPGSSEQRTGLGDETSLVQVIDSTGRVVLASAALDGLAPLTRAPQPGASVTSVGAVVPGEGDPYVVVAVGGADGGWAVATRSLESVDAAVASTTRLLLIGVPLLVALVGALGWALAALALRPVERLRVRASEITAAGADARLPTDGMADEVGRLAVTLNEMLARLDAAARGQRQFVADASHELRSPVAAIRTVMEVAGSGAGTDWLDVRRDVLLESARLERLVHDLLATARRDAAGRATPAREPLRAAALLTEAARRPRRVPIDLVLEADPVVLGDPVALAGVVLNLLDNAERHARSHVELRLRLDRDHAVVSVVDDGDGVAAADAERVFERFTRLDDARARDSGGSGLGLAIARAVAQENAGSLDLDRTHGPGARFELRLPVVPGSAQ